MKRFVYFVSFSALVAEGTATRYYTINYEGEASPVPNGRIDLDGEDKNGIPDSVYVDRDLDREDKNVTDSVYVDARKTRTHAKMTNRMSRAMLRHAEANQGGLKIPEVPKADVKASSGDQNTAKPQSKTVSPTVSPPKLEHDIQNAADGRQNTPEGQNPLLTDGPIISATVEKSSVERPNAIEHKPSSMAEKSLAIAVEKPSVSKEEEKPKPLERQRLLHSPHADEVAKKDNDKQDKETVHEEKRQAIITDVRQPEVKQEEQPVKLQHKKLSVRGAQKLTLQMPGGVGGDDGPKQLLGTIGDKKATNRKIVNTDHKTQGSHLEKSSPSEEVAALKASQGGVKWNHSPKVGHSSHSHYDQGATDRLWGASGFFLLGFFVIFIIHRFRAQIRRM